MQTLEYSVPLKKIFQAPVNPQKLCDENKRNKNDACIRI